MPKQGFKMWKVAFVICSQKRKNKRPLCTMPKPHKKCTVSCWSQNVLLEIMSFDNLLSHLKIICNGLSNLFTRSSKKCIFFKPIVRTHAGKKGEDFDRKRFSWHLTAMHETSLHYLKKCLSCSNFLSNGLEM